jgi:hypothetical protein
MRSCPPVMIEPAGASAKSDCYEAVAAGCAARDSRASQREAVLRLMIPLLTAFPKARLTARI